ncbi:MAG: DUF58 domain-containing protein [Pseudomarimonas sp.]
MIATAPVTQPGIECDLAELLALRLRAGELRASVNRRSADRNAGARHSPFRGRGMDYAESRLYAAGDDVRHIDWRVTARTGKTHTKLYQAERERITAVVVDTSLAMGFGTRVCFKRVQATRLAALMSWYAEADGDRLCAVASGPGASLVPPAGARRGVLRVLKALVGYSQAQQESDGPSLAATLDRLGRVLRPGSHVLLLVDHRSIDADALRSLTHLRPHHDLIAAVLVDPIERVAPPPARYPVLAGGLRSILGLEAAAVRAAWQQHFDTALAHAHDGLRRAGVRARDVATDEDPVDALRLLLRGVTQRKSA